MDDKTLPAGAPSVSYAKYIESCFEVFLPMQENNKRNKYGATHQNRLTGPQKWAKLGSVAVHHSESHRL
jgi:hypothetical protein